MNYHINGSFKNSFPKFPPKNQCFDMSQHTNKWYFYFGFYFYAQS